MKIKESAKQHIDEGVELVLASGMVIRVPAGTSPTRVARTSEEQLLASTDRHGLDRRGLQTQGRNRRGRQADPARGYKGGPPRGCAAAYRCLRVTGACGQPGYGGISPFFQIAGPQAPIPITPSYALARDQ